MTWPNSIPYLRPGGRFSKAPETFRVRKAKAKSQTLRLQSCFIHIFLMWTQVHFMQEISGIYTSPFSHTDERKMAFTGPKSFRGSRETGTWSLSYDSFQTWLVISGFQFRPTFWKKKASYKDKNANTIPYFLQWPKSIPLKITPFGTAHTYKGVLCTHVDWNLEHGWKVWFICESAERTGALANVFFFIIIRFALF